MKYLELDTVKFIFMTLVKQEYAAIQSPMHTHELRGKPDDMPAVHPDDNLVGRQGGTGSDGIQRVKSLILSLEHQSFDTAEKYLRHILNSQAYQLGHHFKNLVDKVIMKSVFVKMNSDAIHPITMYAACKQLPTHKPSLFAALFSEKENETRESAVSRRLRYDILGTRPDHQHTAQNWLAKKAGAHSGYDFNQAAYQAVCQRKREYAQEQREEHKKLFMQAMSSGYGGGAGAF